MSAEVILAQIGVNLIWQTALLGGAVFVALRFVSRDDASTRYNFALAAFFGCLLFFIMPFLPNFSGSTVTVFASDLLAQSTPKLDASILSPAVWTDADSISSVAATTSFKIDVMYVFLSLWGVGAGIGGLRLSLAAFQSRQWVRAGSALLLPKNVSLSRDVVIKTSKNVDAPLVLGVFRPVILVPQDFSRHTFPAQDIAVLEHEIAHIRRNDVAVNFAQHIVLTMLWWCLPLHWLHHIIGVEREKLCDDIAALRSGNGRILARALIDIAQQKTDCVTPHIAAAIHPRARSLSARIERLCKHSPSTENAMTTSTAKKFIVATAAIPLSLAFIASVTPRVTLAFAHPHLSGEDGDYNSALTAQQNRLYQAAREGNTWLAGSILDAGETPNFTSPGNGTPLIEAVRSGNQDMITLLITHGADVNLTSPGDGSPLIAAASYGHNDVLQYLVNSGAQVDLASSGDGNPLIATVHAGRLDTAKVLLSYRADINAQVPGDETPLINAAQSGHLDMVKFFVDNGADVSLGMWAARGKDQEWRTPLSEAKKHGHKHVIAYLKRQGASD